MDTVKHEAGRHTQGPWVVKHGAASEIYIDSSKGAVVLCEGLFGMQDEISANARLIAAAPELLHAAQWALDHYNGKHMGANTVTLLENAIKKAMGEL